MSNKYVHITAADGGGKGKTNYTIAKLRSQLDHGRSAGIVDIDCTSKASALLRKKKFILAAIDPTDGESATWDGDDAAIRENFDPILEHFGVVDHVNIDLGAGVPRNFANYCKNSGIDSFLEDEGVKVEVSIVTSTEKSDLEGSWKRLAHFTEVFPTAEFNLVVVHKLKANRNESSFAEQVAGNHVIAEEIARWQKEVGLRVHEIPAANEFLLKTHENATMAIVDVARSMEHTFKTVVENIAVPEANTTEYRFLSDAGYFKDGVPSYAKLRVSMVRDMAAVSQWHVATRQAIDAILEPSFAKDEASTEEATEAA